MPAKNIWSKIGYLILGFLIVIFHIYLLNRNLEESYIIKNGETVYAVIGNRYCGYRSSIDVYYKEIKDIIHLSQETCLSVSCTEGNLYPVKYLVGKNRLVAPWTNVKKDYLFLSVGLCVFTFFAIWGILDFIFTIFPNRFHKFRKLYYNIDQPFNRIK